jgi:hypothetical protein
MLVFLGQDDVQGTVDSLFWNEYVCVIGKPSLQRFM